MSKDKFENNDKILDLKDMEPIPSADSAQEKARAIIDRMIENNPSILTDLSPEEIIALKNDYLETIREDLYARDVSAKLEKWADEEWNTDMDIDEIIENYIVNDVTPDDYIDDEKLFDAVRDYIMESYERGEFLTLNDMMDLTRAWEE